ncbi:MAG: substrate-binding domain-containing protein [Sphaerochaeta sp.]
MKYLIPLLLIPLLLFSGCSNKQQSTDQPYRIAVITMMQGGEFWGALKNGARSARLATDAVLEFFAPVNESDYAGQIACVERAIEQEFDAIILSPSHHTRLSHSVNLARERGIKVVLANTDLFQSEKDFLITSEYQEIGKQVAEHAFSHFTESEPINALIIGSLPHTTSMMDLITSLESAFKRRNNASIKTVSYSYSSEILARDTARNALMADPTINLVFALEEYTAHGVASALVNDQKIHFIAFGNTQHEIQLLEEEVIDALVVVNSFNLGYRSVLAAVDLIEGRNPVPKSVDYALVTKESMFSEEHQHLLFQTFQ